MIVDLPDGHDGNRHDGWYAQWSIGMISKGLGVLVVDWQTDGHLQF